MSRNDPMRPILDRVRQCLAEALVEVEEGRDLAGIADLIRSRIPVHETREWLLAAHVLMDRAVGIAEGWLDSRDLPPEIREVLIADLSILLSQGIAQELTPQSFAELRGDIASRPVCWRDVAVPLLFVIEILTINGDPDVEAVLLLD